MPNQLNKQIEIKLTSAQRAHVSQQSGLNLPSIRMQPTELELLAMVAVAAGNETLPVTPSAIKQVLEPGQNSEQGSDPFTLEIRLTPEQKEHIRQATGKRVSSLLIVPDDFSQLYTEIWDDMKPIRVGRTMVIKRADSAYETPLADRIIQLPSGDYSKQDVFGTGRHPTTQLSLMLLEEYVKDGDRVLDLGTGSGILAVAAAKLGASEVLALDVEADAVTIAQETIAVNDVANIVEVGQGSIESAAPPYDVVAANIFSNVIIRLAPDLATSLRQAGVLITCGLVITRAEEVADVVCAAGFSLEKQRSQDEWLGMAFRKL